jgi:Flp pilus assembly protein TadG
MATRKQQQKRRLDRNINGPKRQTGATAIEYAIAFPVFFTLFYAILTYGFIFLARLGLQHAAEDGARAALRYPANIPQGVTELQIRQSQAELVSRQQISWLQSPTVDVSICTIGADDCSGKTIDTSCSQAAAYDFTPRCQVVVTVDYPYQQKPIVPLLPVPGFGLLVPANLQGSAKVLLDGGVSISL